MSRRLAGLAGALCTVPSATLLLAGCGAVPDRADEGGTERILHEQASTAPTGSTALPALPAGVVTVAGTSDPLTASEIRRYRGGGNDVQASYDGTAAGFDALCSGQADLVDSSTTITADALDACHAHGLDVVQLEIAADAVVVAIRNETDIGGDCLSTEQTRDIFRAASPYANWSQVGFQDVPMKVGGPSADQDDYQVFATDVLGSLRPGPADMRFDYADRGDDDGARIWVTGEPDWQSRADQAGGLQVALSTLRSQLAEQRQKYAAARDELVLAQSALTADTQVQAGATQLAADQKALFTAQGQMQGAQIWITRFQRQVALAKKAYDGAAAAGRSLDGLRGRIALYGFNYYEVHEEQLRPMEITLPTGKRDCVFPNQQTIMNGQYPLAHRMLLTTTTRSLQRGEVRDFLTAVLSRVSQDAAAAHLVSLDRATLDQQQAWVDGAQAPTVLVGRPTAAATVAHEVPAQ